MTFPKIEIFCGTGGVGKTTIATARALALGASGKSVLLMTIDPAKRLKEVLGMSEKLAGKVEHLSLSLKDQKVELDALLMNPEVTMKKLSRETGGEVGRILSIVARPNGGMNEILSLVEVNNQLATGKYDCLILDTPPGGHFLDFLKSCQKIQQFFDGSFIQFFQYFLSTESRQKKNILGKLVNSGIEKLLYYLKKVTGDSFVKEFVEAVDIIYTNKTEFLEAISLEKKLQNPDFCRIFLVTSVEQSKFSEALGLGAQIGQNLKQKNHLIINKCLENQWQMAQESSDSPNVQKLVLSLQAREREMSQQAKQNFDQVLHFNEVLETSPFAHVESLALQWKEYELSN